MQSDSLEKTVKHTHYAANPDRDGERLHPDYTVDNYAPAKDPIEALEVFKNRLTDVYEGDVGDWKRDMNAGLAELRQALVGQEFWVMRTLDHMQSLLGLGYNSREDIESMKHELHKRADGIVRGLHKEAWRERTENKPA